MKKSLLWIFAGCLVLTSCVSTKLEEGEELVKYIDMGYEPKNKKELTFKELREDCDMLKYLLYNNYAGIDEAIENGFDLDATVEKIYEASEKEKNGLGTVSTSDFSNIITRTIAADLTNSDQHLYVAGSVRYSYTLHYSDVYFEKAVNSENSDIKYVVKKIQQDSNLKNNKAASANKGSLEQVLPGMIYDGDEANLFELLTDEGPLYRYGIITNKNIKSMNLPVDGQKISVPARTEKSIPTKQNWTGLKTTDSTVYVSLGDCQQVMGTSNFASLSEEYWNKYLSQVSEATKGKDKIIFDLRSNPGGFMQYPAKILSAAFYNEHMDEEFQKNMRAFFFNQVSKDCKILVSPSLCQDDEKYYTKKGNYTDAFNAWKPEVQEFFKKYWKTMKTRPVRKFISQEVMDTNLTEFPEPDFKGDIYVLINEGSGSAAEFGTQMTYLLSDQGIKVHLVGENSWGGMKYGGMNSSVLPNSGLWLSMGIYFGEAPSASENPSWHGEGYGWYPDYWATNDTIMNTLENLTGDMQLREVLAGLEKNQL